MRDIIRDLHLYLSRDYKEIKNINLKCIIKTNMIFQVMKLMKYLEISFARLIKKILVIYKRFE